MHTGRFRQGVDDPDYPTWKTRFRCALNKLPDIQEVKDLSKLDGPDPFRAYRFMPRKVSDMAHMQRIQMPSNGGNIQQQLSNTSSLPDILNDVRDNEQRSPENLPSDLNDIDVSQFIGSQQMKTEPIENMDTSTDAIGYTGQLVLNHDRCSEDPMSLLHTTHGLPMSPPLHSNTPPEMNKMRIKLRYRREEVAEHVVTNPLGCRLFYGPRIDQMTNQFNKEIYGPDGVDLLHFPLCLNMINNQKQEELTIKLLDVLDRGLVLENDNGDIYATRKCRCVIFFASPQTNGVPLKLKRDERTKIFDYRNYFEPMLHCYLNERSPRPSADVLLGFGQKWNPCTVPYNNILISATVFHCMAQYRLDQVTCSSPLSPPIERSKSDDIDKFLDQYKRVEAIGSNYPLQTNSPMCV